MNIEELEEALADILPGYEIGTDKNGQVVIFTGLTEDEDGELIDMDGEDGDSIFDDDTDQLDDDEDDEDD